MANSNVKIYDPIDIITNESNLYNCVPKSEDLFIYAEMNAVKRGSSVLVSNNGVLTQELNNSNSDLTVSLLGHDENGYYTTKYTDNIANNSKIQYEGFGMVDIKIKMNSSYVPMVTVEFIDIRGMCFFNNSDTSPYRILFDFPPAIFQLTVKGYYGKPLRYQLHLVRTNTKFESNTGNYHITAEFVANTFAPLTDILFKYIEIIPLIDDWNNGVSMGADFKSKPKHVYQLLYKLGNLYDNVTDVVKNSKESDDFNNSKDKYNNILNVFESISGFQSNLGDFANGDQSSASIFIKSQDENLSTMRFIKNISEYDTIVRNYGSDTPDSPNESLLLNIKINDVPNNKTSAITVLTKLGDSLVKEINNKNIYSATNKDYKIRNIKYPSESGSTYICLDITTMYIKLFRQMVSAKENVSKSNEKLNDTLNKIAITELGFKPTIGKIFEILCNDIDATFDKLRQVAEKAEVHHEKYKDKILKSGYMDNGDKIRAFPLFVEVQTDSNPCATSRQVKTYPKFTNLNNADEKFPELQFIDDFINAFIRNKKIENIEDLKNKTDENGNKKWIPISAADSTIIPGGGTESPYRDLVADDIFKMFLNRYYVYTQHVLPLNFYGKYEYDKLFAKSEALNISNSISDEKLLIPQLINMCKVGIENPYNVLSGYSNFSTVDPNVININSSSYYHPKSSPSYEGIYLIDAVDIMEKNTSDANDPTNEFIETNCRGFWNNIINFVTQNKIKDAKFSSENLVYFKDLEPEDAFDSNFYTFTSDITRNTVIADTDYVGSVYGILGGDITGQNDDEIQKAINVLSASSITNVIKLSLISSNFAALKTPYFSDYIKLFTIPSIVEMPSILPIFIGAALSCDINDLLEIKSIFIESGNIDWWNNIYNQAIYYNNNISINDKKVFVDFYEKFNENNPNLIEDFTKMLEGALSEDGEGIEDALVVDGTYENISIALNKRIFMAITSDIALTNNSGSTYQSIPTILTDTAKNKINTNLFKTFFLKLKSQLENRLSELNETTKNITQSINDNDIKTQLYYSFKNIVDKWIVDVPTESPLYMGSAKPLIDRFAFVDRAMNDIGGLDEDRDGCIINVDGLREVSKDFDVNVFSMFSRILSDNNFEFFPLQNFMSFQGDGWRDAFKIHTIVNQSVTTASNFICMYVGGNSTILNTGNKNYVDDGITDLENDKDLLDFNSTVCNDTPTNNNFAYSNIKAFKVKFGQQNQSIFKDIELDSTEFSETNESLAILSKLASDESSASPVPKGQNLFSTYENRSYTAKVNMIGDAMIQPTQYFQLENVPMYNGAYLITSVEHSIVPNTMTTSFTGTRIAKYPKPIVTEFAKSVLSEGSSIDDYSSSSSAGSSYGDLSAGNLPEQAKYNSMYTLKI